MLLVFKNMFFAVYEFAASTDLCRGGGRKLEKSRVV